MSNLGWCSARKRFHDLPDFVRRDLVLKCAWCGELLRDHG